MELSKPELRKDLKSKRLSLNEVERQNKSQRILKKLASVVNWRDPQSVHIFEPIHVLGEVDLSNFHFSNNLYTSKKIDGVWRVVSLSSENSIPDKFDVIIVPMLGFNEDLHRLGYGGGYYDKLLASQTSAKKIGVCFELGLVKNLPIEDHDIAMDIIVTEDRVRVL